jgi:2,3-bisphosphoglycerate-independent phosphoglycerate mutase
MSFPAKTAVQPTGPVAVIILDGFGLFRHTDANGVFLANTPVIDASMEKAKEQGLYTTLYAHGTHVGLPDDTEMGNSEVGHNGLLLPSFHLSALFLTPS